ncbi:peptidoglycan-binding protein [Streptomyces parvulus]|uniref:peptidoglycan-binding protein n=1 Tax=Streptomyces parvulus TaxID=146923 RepID=UPI00215DAC1C|nr:peptidoglycan-binding protein [Streptomyces parvulus]
MQLRRLKDRGDLSTRQLAAKTGYSTRSWQRYLNGRALPPRDAVEAIARTVGENPLHLLALHETVAPHFARQHTSSGETAEGASAPPSGRFAYGRYPRALVAGGSVALILSISLALVLAVQLARARAQLSQTRTDTVAAPSTVTETLMPVIYTCRLKQTENRWYAGWSQTTTTILAYTHVGSEVAEAQCLLRRAGSDPGDIDGVFGPKTQRAVQRIQQRNELVVDGVIGPHTWNVLREVDAK